MCRSHVQGCCLAPGLVTARDPHWLGASGRREGRKRRISKRQLGQRFRGLQTQPEVAPVPLKCHLAPVNSAVVFRQLRDNAWPLCNGHEMKLKIAAAPCRTPGCSTCAPRAPSSELMWALREDLSLLLSCPRPCLVSARPLLSSLRHVGRMLEDAVGCWDVLGGCWGMLGCCWRFWGEGGGCWGMLEDVQGMLGAAKLPILAPGTACFLPKPRQGAESSLPEPNVGTDATTFPA